MLCGNLFPADGHAQLHVKDIQFAGIFEQILGSEEGTPMLILLIIIVIGAILASTMILAAAMLSSSISGRERECEFPADEFTAKQSLPNSPDRQNPPLPQRSLRHIL